VDQCAVADLCGCFCDSSAVPHTLPNKACAIAFLWRGLKVASEFCAADSCLFLGVIS
jgi:hypothetical protein